MTVSLPLLLLILLPVLAEAELLSLTDNKFHGSLSLPEDFPDQNAFPELLRGERNKSQQQSLRHSQNVQADLCLDTEDNCATWAGNGWCTYDYISDRCKVSCDTCAPGASATCFDIGIHCDIIKSYGLCDHLQSICKRSCGTCDDTAPGSASATTTSASTATTTPAPTSTTTTASTSTTTIASTSTTSSASTTTNTASTSTMTSVSTTTNTASTPTTTSASTTTNTASTPTTTSASTTTNTASTTSESTTTNTASTSTTNSASTTTNTASTSTTTSASTTTNTASTSTTTSASMTTNTASTSSTTSASTSTTSSTSASTTTSSTTTSSTSTSTPMPSQTLKVVLVAIQAQLAKLQNALNAIIAAIASAGRRRKRQGIKSDKYNDEISAHMRTIPFDVLETILSFVKDVSINPLDLSIDKLLEIQDLVSQVVIIETEIEITSLTVEQNALIENLVKSNTLVIRKISSEVILIEKTEAITEKKILVSEISLIFEPMMMTLMELSSSAIGTGSMSATVSLISTVINTCVQISNNGLTSLTVTTLTLLTESLSSLNTIESVSNDDLTLLTEALSVVTQASEDIVIAETVIIESEQNDLQYSISRQVSGALIKIESKFVLITTSASAEVYTSDVVTGALIVLQEMKKSTITLTETQLEIILQFDSEINIVIQEGKTLESLTVFKSVTSTLITEVSASIGKISTEIKVEEKAKITISANFFVVEIKSIVESITSKIGTSITIEDDSETNPLLQNATIVLEKISTTRLTTSLITKLEKIRDECLNMLENAVEGTAISGIDELLIVAQTQVLQINIVAAEAEETAKLLVETKILSKTSTLIVNVLKIVTDLTTNNLVTTGTTEEERIISELTTIIEKFTSLEYVIAQEDIIKMEEIMLEFQGMTTVTESFVSLRIKAESALSIIIEKQLIINEEKSITSKLSILKDAKLLLSEVFAIFENLETTGNTELEVTDVRISSFVTLIRDIQNGVNFITSDQISEISVIIDEFQSISSISGLMGVTLAITSVITTIDVTELSITAVKLEGNIQSAFIKAVDLLITTESLLQALTVKVIDIVETEISTELEAVILQISLLRQSTFSMNLTLIDDLTVTLEAFKSFVSEDHSVGVTNLDSYIEDVKSTKLLLQKIVSLNSLKSNTQEILYTNVENLISSITTSLATFVRDSTTVTMEYPVIEDVVTFFETLIASSASITTAAIDELSIYKKKIIDLTFQSSSLEKIVNIENVTKLANEAIIKVQESKAIEVAVYDKFKSFESAQTGLVVFENILHSLKKINEIETESDITITLTSIVSSITLDVKLILDEDTIENLYIELSSLFLIEGEAGKPAGLESVIQTILELKVSIGEYVSELKSEYEIALSELTLSKVTEVLSVFNSDLKVIMKELDETQMIGTTIEKFSNILLYIQSWSQDILTVTLDDILIFNKEWTTVQDFIAANKGGTFGGLIDILSISESVIKESVAVSEKLELKKQLEAKITIFSEALTIVEDITVFVENIITEVSVIDVTQTENSIIYDSTLILEIIVREGIEKFKISDLTLMKESLLTITATTSGIANIFKIQQLIKETKSIINLELKSSSSTLESIKTLSSLKEAQSFFGSVEQKFISLQSITSSTSSSLEIEVSVITEFLTFLGTFSVETVSIAAITTLEFTLKELNTFIGSLQPGYIIKDLSLTIKETSIVKKKIINVVNEYTELIAAKTIQVSQKKSLEVIQRISESMILLIESADVSEVSTSEEDLQILEELSVLVQQISSNIQISEDIVISMVEKITSIAVTSDIIVEFENIMTQIQTIKTKIEKSLVKGTSITQVLLEIDYQKQYNEILSSLIQTVTYITSTIGITSSTSNEIENTDIQELVVLLQSISMTSITETTIIDLNLQMQFFSTLVISKGVKLIGLADLKKIAVEKEKENTASLSAIEGSKQVQKMLLIFEETEMSITSIVNILLELKENTEVTTAEVSNEVLNEIIKLISTISRQTVISKSDIELLRISQIKLSTLTSSVSISVEIIKEALVSISSATEAIQISKKKLESSFKSLSQYKILTQTLSFLTSLSSSITDITESEEEDEFVNQIISELTKWQQNTLSITEESYTSITNQMFKLQILLKTKDSIKGVTLLNELTISLQSSVSTEISLIENEAIEVKDVSIKKEVLSLFESFKLIIEEVIESESVALKLTEIFSIFNNFQSIIEKNKSIFQSIFAQITSISEIFTKTPDIEELTQVLSTTESLFISISKEVIIFEFNLEYTNLISRQKETGYLLEDCIAIVITLQPASELTSTQTHTHEVYSADGLFTEIQELIKNLNVIDISIDFVDSLILKIDELKDIMDKIPEGSRIDGLDVLLKYAKFQYSAISSEIQKSSIIQFTQSSLATSENILITLEEFITIVDISEVTISSSTDTSITDSTLIDIATFFEGISLFDEETLSQVEEYKVILSILLSENGNIEGISTFLTSVSNIIVTVKTNIEETKQTIGLLQYNFVIVSAQNVVSEIINLLPIPNINFDITSIVFEKSVYEFSLQLNKINFESISITELDVIKKGMDIIKEALSNSEGKHIAYLEQIEHKLLLMKVTSKEFFAFTKKYVLYTNSEEIFTSSMEIISSASSTLLQLQSQVSETVEEYEEISIITEAYNLFKSINDISLISNEFFTTLDSLDLISVVITEGKGVKYLNELMSLTKRVENIASSVVTNVVSMKFMFSITQARYVFGKFIENLNTVIQELTEDEIIEIQFDYDTSNTFSQIISQAELFIRNENILDVDMLKITSNLELLKEVDLKQYLDIDFIKNSIETLEASIKSIMNIFLLEGSKIQIQEFTSLFFQVEELMSSSKSVLISIEGKLVTNLTEIDLNTINEIINTWSLGVYFITEQDVMLFRSLIFGLENIDEGDIAIEITGTIELVEKIAQTVFTNLVTQLSFYISFKTSTSKTLTVEEIEKSKALEEINQGSQKYDMLIQCDGMLMEIITILELAEESTEELLEKNDISTLLKELYEAIRNIDFSLNNLKLSLLADLGTTGAKLYRIISKNLHVSDIEYLRIVVSYITELRISVSETAKSLETFYNVSEVILMQRKLSLKINGFDQVFQNLRTVIGIPDKNLKLDTIDQGVFSNITNVLLNWALDSSTLSVNDLMLFITLTKEVQLIELVEGQYIEGYHILEFILNDSPINLEESLLGDEFKSSMLYVAQDEIRLTLLSEAETVAQNLTDQILTLSEFLTGDDTADPDLHEHLIDLFKQIIQISELWNLGEINKTQIICFQQFVKEFGEVVFILQGSIPTRLNDVNLRRMESLTEDVIALPAIEDVITSLKVVSKSIVSKKINIINQIQIGRDDADIEIKLNIFSQLMFFLVDIENKTIIPHITNVTFSELEDVFTFLTDNYNDNFFIDHDELISLIIPLIHNFQEIDTETTVINIQEVIQMCRMYISSLKSEININKYIKAIENVKNMYVSIPSEIAENKLIMDTKVSEIYHYLNIFRKTAYTISIEEIRKLSSLSTSLNIVIHKFGTNILYLNDIKIILADINILCNKYISYIRTISLKKRTLNILQESNEELIKLIEFVEPYAVISNEEDLAKLAITEALDLLTRYTINLYELPLDFKDILKNISLTLVMPSEINITNDFYDIITRLKNKNIYFGNMVEQYESLKLTLLIHSIVENIKENLLAKELFSGISLGIDNDACEATNISTNPGTTINTLSFLQDDFSHTEVCNSTDIICFVDSMMIALQEADFNADDLLKLSSKAEDYFVNINSHAAEYISISSDDTKCIENILNVTNDLSKTAAQLHISLSSLELSVQVNAFNYVLEEAEIATLKLKSYIGQTGSEDIESTLIDIENILEIWSYGSYYITLDTVLNFRVLITTIGKAISTGGSTLVESDVLTTLIDLVHENFMTGLEFSSPLISNLKVISNIKDGNETIEEIELLETFGLIYNTYYVATVCQQLLMNMTDSLYLLNDAIAEGNDTIGDLLFDFESIILTTKSNVDNFNPYQFRIMGLISDYHYKIDNIISLNEGVLVNQSKIEQIINGAANMIQNLNETIDSLTEYNLAVTQFLIHQDEQLLLEDFSAQIMNWLFPNNTALSTTNETATSTTSADESFDIEDIILKLFQWSFDANSVTAESIVLVRRGLVDNTQSFSVLQEENSTMVDILHFILDLKMANITQLSFKEIAVSNAKIQQAINKYSRALNLLMNYHSALHSIGNITNITHSVSDFLSENLIIKLFNATDDIIQNWDVILNIKKYEIIEIELFLNEINRQISTIEKASFVTGEDLKEKIIFLQNETNNAVEVLTIYYSERKNLTDILHRNIFITQLKLFANFSQTLFNESLNITDSEVEALEVVPMDSVPITEEPTEKPTTTVPTTTVPTTAMPTTSEIFFDAIGLIFDDFGRQARGTFSNSSCSHTDIKCFILKIDSTLGEIDIVTGDLSDLKTIYYDYIKSIMFFINYSDNATSNITAASAINENEQEQEQEQEADIEFELVRRVYLTTNSITEEILILLDDLIAQCDMNILELDTHHDNFVYSVDPSPYYEDV